MTMGPMGGNPIPPGFTPTPLNIQSRDDVKTSDPINMVDSAPEGNPDSEGYYMVDLSTTMSKFPTTGSNLCNVRAKYKLKDVKNKKGEVVRQDPYWVYKINVKFKDGTVCKKPKYIEATINADTISEEDRGCAKQMSSQLGIAMVLATFTTAAQCEDEAEYQNELGNGEVQFDYDSDSKSWSIKKPEVKSPGDRDFFGQTFLKEFDKTRKRDRAKVQFVVGDDGKIRLEAKSQSNTARTARWFKNRTIAYLNIASPLKNLFRKSAYFFTKGKSLPKGALEESGSEKKSHRKIIIELAGAFAMMDFPDPNKPEDEDEAKLQETTTDQDSLHAEADKEKSNIQVEGDTSPPPSKGGMFGSGALTPQAQAEARAQKLREEEAARKKTKERTDAPPPPAPLPPPAPSGGGGQVGMGLPPAKSQLPEEEE